MPGVDVRSTTVTDRIIKLSIHANSTESPSVERVVNCYAVKEPTEFSVQLEVVKGEASGVWIAARLLDWIGCYEDSGESDDLPADVRGALVDDSPLGGHRILAAHVRLGGSRALSAAAEVGVSAAADATVTVVWSPTLPLPPSGDGTVAAADVDPFASQFGPSRAAAAAVRGTGGDGSSRTALLHAAPDGLGGLVVAIGGLGSLGRDDGTVAIVSISRPPHNGGHAMEWARGRVTWHAACGSAVRLAPLDRGARAAVAETSRMRLHVAAGATVLVECGGAGGSGSGSASEGAAEAAAVAADALRGARGHGGVDHSSDAARGADAAAVPATPAVATYARVRRLSSAADGSVWAAIVAAGVDALGGVSFGGESPAQLIIARLGGAGLTVVSATAINTNGPLDPESGVVGLVALAGGGVYVAGTTAVPFDLGGGVPPRDGYGTCVWVARYSAACAHEASRFVCGRGDVGVTAAARHGVSGVVLALRTTASVVTVGRVAVHQRVSAVSEIQGGPPEVAAVLVALGGGSTTSASEIVAVEWRSWVGRGVGDVAVRALKDDAGYAAHAALPADQQRADAGYVALVEVGGVDLSVDISSAVAERVVGQTKWLLVRLDAVMQVSAVVNIVDPYPYVKAGSYAASGVYRGVDVASDAHGGWWVCGYASGPVAPYTPTPATAQAWYEVHVHVDGVTFARAPTATTFGGATAADAFRARACVGDGAGGIYVASGYATAHTRGGTNIDKPSGPTHHAVTHIASGGTVQTAAGLHLAAGAAGEGWGEIDAIAMVRDPVSGTCRAVVGGAIAHASKVRYTTRGDARGQVGVVAAGACVRSQIEGMSGAGARAAVIARPYATALGANALVALAVGAEVGGAGGYFIAVQSAGQTAYAGLPSALASYPNQLIIARHAADGTPRWAKVIQLLGAATPLGRVRVAADGAGGVWVAATVPSGAVNCLEAGLPVTTALGGSDLLLARVDGSGRAAVCKQLGGPEADDVVGITVRSSGMVAVAAGVYGPIIDVGLSPSTLVLSGSAGAVIFEVDKGGTTQYARAYGVGTGASIYSGGVTTLGGSGCDEDLYVVFVTTNVAVGLGGGIWLPAGVFGTYLVRMKRDEAPRSYTVTSANDYVAVATLGTRTVTSLAAAADGTIWVSGTASGASVTLGNGVVYSQTMPAELHVRVAVQTSHGKPTWAVLGSVHMEYGAGTVLPAAGVEATVADGRGGLWAVSSYTRSHVRGAFPVNIPGGVSSSHVLTHITGGGVVDYVEPFGITTGTTGSARWADVALTGGCEAVLAGTVTTVAAVYGPAAASTEAATPARAAVLRVRLGGCGGGSAVAHAQCGRTHSSAVSSVVKGPTGAAGVVVLGVASGAAGGGAVPVPDRGTVPGASDYADGPAHYWTVVSSGGVAGSVYGGYVLPTAVTATGAFVARHTTASTGGGRGSGSDAVTVVLPLCFVPTALVDDGVGGLWVGGSVAAAGGCACGAGHPTVATGGAIMCRYSAAGLVVAQTSAVGSGAEAVGFVAVTRHYRHTEGAIASLRVATAGGAAHLTVTGGGESGDVAAGGGGGVNVRNALVVVDGSGRLSFSRCFDGAGGTFEGVAIAARHVPQDGTSDAWAIVGHMAAGATVAFGGTAGTYTATGAAQAVLLYVGGSLQPLGVSLAARVNSGGGSVGVVGVASDGRGGVWVGVGLQGGTASALTTAGGIVIPSLCVGCGVVLQLSKAGAYVSTVGATAGEVRLQSLVTDGEGGLWVGAEATGAAVVRLGGGTGSAFAAVDAGARTAAVLRIGADGDVMVAGTVGGDVAGSGGSRETTTLVAAVHGCRVVAMRRLAVASGGQAGAQQMAHPGNAWWNSGGVDIMTVTYSTSGTCAVDQQHAPVAPVVVKSPMVFTAIQIVKIVKHSATAYAALATASGIGSIQTAGGGKVENYPEMHVVMRISLDGVLSSSIGTSMPRMLYATIGASAQGDVWLAGSCTGEIMLRWANTLTLNPPDYDACFVQYQFVGGVVRNVSAGAIGGVGDQGATAIVPLYEHLALVALQLADNHARLAHLTSPRVYGGGRWIEQTAAPAAVLDIHGDGAAEVTISSVEAMCASPRWAYVALGSVSGTLRVVGATTGTSVHLGAHMFMLRVSADLKTYQHVRLVDGAVNATALATDMAGGWWACGNTVADGGVRAGNETLHGVDGRHAFAVRVSGGAQPAIVARWSSGVDAREGSAVHTGCDSDGSGGVWVAGTQLHRRATSRDGFALRVGTMASVPMIARLDGSGREVSAFTYGSGRSGTVEVGAVAAMPGCRLLVAARHRLHSAPNPLELGAGSTITSHGSHVVQILDAECVAYQRYPIGIVDACATVPVAAMRHVGPVVVLLARADGGGYYAVARASQAAAMDSVEFPNGAAQLHQLLIVEYNARHEAVGGRAIDWGTPAVGVNGLVSVASDRAGGVWVVVNRAATAPAIDFGRGLEPRRGGSDVYAVHYTREWGVICAALFLSPLDETAVGSAVTSMGTIMLLFTTKTGPAQTMFTLSSRISHHVPPSMSISVVAVVDAVGAVVAANTYRSSSASIVPHSIFYSCALRRAYVTISGSPSMSSVTDMSDESFSDTLSSIHVIGMDEFARQIDWTRGSGVQTSIDSSAAYRGATVHFAGGNSFEATVQCARLRGPLYNSLPQLTGVVDEVASWYSISSTSGRSPAAQTRVQLSVPSGTPDGLRCAPDPAGAGGGMWTLFDYSATATRGTLTFEVPPGHTVWSSILHVVPHISMPRFGHAVELRPLGASGAVSPSAAVTLPSCEVVAAFEVSGPTGIDFGVPDADLGGRLGQLGSGTSAVVLRSATCGGGDEPSRFDDGPCADGNHPSMDFMVRTTNTEDTTVLAVARGIGRSDYYFVIRTSGVTFLGNSESMYGIPSSLHQVSIVSVKSAKPTVIATFSGPAVAPGPLDPFASPSLAIDAAGAIWVGGTWRSTETTMAASLGSVPMAAPLVITRPGGTTADAFAVRVDSFITISFYGSAAADEELVGLVPALGGGVVIALTSRAPSIVIGSHTLPLASATMSSLIVAVGPTGIATDAVALTGATSATVRVVGVASRCSSDGNDHYYAVVEHAGAFAVGAAAVTGSGVSTIVLDARLRGVRAAPLATVASAAVLALDKNAHVAAAADSGDLWVAMNLIAGRSLTVGGVTYTSTNAHGVVVRVVANTLAVGGATSSKAGVVGAVHRIKGIAAAGGGRAYVTYDFSDQLVVGSGVAPLGATVTLSAPTFFTAVEFAADGSVVRTMEYGRSLISPGVALSASAVLGPIMLQTCEVLLPIAQGPWTATSLGGGFSAACGLGATSRFAIVPVLDCKPAAVAAAQCALRPRPASVYPPVLLARGTLRDLVADRAGGFYAVITSAHPDPLPGLGGVRASADGSASHTYITRHLATGAPVCAATVDTVEAMAGGRGMALRPDGNVWVTGMLGVTPASHTIRFGGHPPEPTGGLWGGWVLRMDPSCDVGRTAIFGVPLATAAADATVVSTVTLYDYTRYTPAALPGGGVAVSMFTVGSFSVGATAVATVAHASTVVIVLDANLALHGHLVLGGSGGSPSLLAATAALADCTSGTLLVGLTSFHNETMAWAAPFGVPSMLAKGSIIVRVDLRAVAVVGALLVADGDGVAPALVVDPTGMAFYAGGPQMAARSGGGVWVTAARYDPLNLGAMHDMSFVFIGPPPAAHMLIGLSPSFDVVSTLTAPMDEMFMYLSSIGHYFTAATPRITGTSTGVWAPVRGKRSYLDGRLSVRVGDDTHGALHVDVSGSTPRVTEEAHIEASVVSTTSFFGGPPINAPLALLDGSCTVVIGVTTPPMPVGNGADGADVFVGGDGDGDVAWVTIRRSTRADCSRPYFAPCSSVPEQTVGCADGIAHMVVTGSVTSNATAAAAGSTWQWDDPRRAGDIVRPTDRACGGGGRGTTGRTYLPAGYTAGGAVDYVGDAVPSASRAFCSSMAADGAQLVVGMGGGAASVYTRGADHYAWRQSLVDSPAARADAFGGAVALRTPPSGAPAEWSATIAVGAPGDSSPAVWPSEEPARAGAAASSSSGSGAVYIYEQTAPGTPHAYSEVAYLKPQAPVVGGAGFGTSVAISRDGRVVAIGIPMDRRDVAGGALGGVAAAALAASSTAAGAVGAGSVALFTRGWFDPSWTAPAGDGLWSPALWLRAPIGGAGHRYGASVDVDGSGAAGTTYEVAVGAPGEGAAYAYSVRPAGGAAVGGYSVAWEVTAMRGTLSPSGVDIAGGVGPWSSAVAFGERVSLSSDSAAGGVRVVAVAAPLDWRCGSGGVTAFPTGDPVDGGTPATRCDTRGGVYIYERVGAAATYTAATVFRGAGTTVGGSASGARVGASVSVRVGSDGLVRAAVGAPGDDALTPPGTVTAGVVGGGLGSYTGGGNASGAVYVLKRTAGGVWGVDSYTKVPVETADAKPRYGDGDVAVANVPIIGASAAHLRVLGCAPGGENILGGENPAEYDHGQGEVGSLYGVRV